MQIVAAALGAAKQDHPAISTYVPCPAAVITCPAGQGIARAAAWGGVCLHSKLAQQTSVCSGLQQRLLCSLQLISCTMKI